MISPCSRRTFLAGSAAFAASAGAANAADLTGLRLAGAVNDDVTPMLYAVASGEMRRVGLDLTVDRANSGSAVAAGVVGGAYQIGKSSVAGLITAHARGIPFVFVAPGGLYESTAPVVALLARSDSNIRTGADLNGKVCAVSAIGDLYQGLGRSERWQVVDAQVHRDSAQRRPGGFGSWSHRCRLTRRAGGL
jgi:ABC-type nitrate/sulfonate/bicarbonate transport system substrate-binding protein